MALPTTISGIATSPACVGPFKSSGGNFYFFGKDGTTATTLQAFKATDPTSSFSSIATKTGFTTAVQYISGYQNGDTIHLCVTDGATTSVNFKYQTFDMSSDTFVTAETIVSGINTQTSGSANAYGSSIVFRGSDSQPIVLRQDTRVANMGNSYSRVSYNRRTGVNTWAATVAVDAGGTVDYTKPECVLGSSNRTHFMWAESSGDAFAHRTLTSANSLQTAATTVASGLLATSLQAVSYDNAGTTKVVATTGTTGTIKTVYFDSGDTPSLNQGTVASITGTNARPHRLMNDGTDVWSLYAQGWSGGDGDVYVAKSTDNGATFATPVSSLTATVGDAEANLSIDGSIYQRGNDFVIPYVVNDNGTLKYNEYVVRSVSNNKTLAADGGTYSLTGSTATPRLARKVAAGTASYALTGSNATPHKGYVLAAGTASYTLNGATATPRHAWKTAAGGGTYSLVGSDAIPKHGWKVPAGGGVYSLTGSDVTLHHTYVIPAGGGIYALTGANAVPKHGWVVVALGGSYALNGSNATPKHGWRLAADGASYELVGNAATPVITTAGHFSISGDPGTYSLNGSNATPRLLRKVIAESAIYLLTGSDATLTKSTVETAAYQDHPFLSTIAQLMGKQPR